MKLNENIILKEKYFNTKASEVYLHLIFDYADINEVWDGWVPIQYRRTGINFDNNNSELFEYLNKVYLDMHPSNYEKWVDEQNDYWNATRSEATKEIFNILKDGKWHCRNCDIRNPNFARRIQDIKEKGYTISTHLQFHCPVCKNNKSTNLMLLPIPRVEIAGNGYETWSTKLRKRILSVLNHIDVYENTSNQNCLPDHKFPEIRWDEYTKEENPENMTDKEICQKFQLLTNQRNQHKREVCRKCTQSGIRGSIFGINYYYYGTSTWDPQIPTKGKEAERGCVGCPWYDIQEWRVSLNKKLGS